MKLLLLIAALAVFAQASPARAEEIEYRRGYILHMGDLPKAPGIFDVPPGGMKDFLSRLSYPPDLRRHRVEGVMLVEVSLDAAGQFLTARVLQSIHPALDRLVVDALRRTRWTPALKKGRSVAATFKFPVEFIASPGRAPAGSR